MKTINEKFILFPARHNHAEIDNLFSVFNETDNVFDLEFSKEFKEKVIYNDNKDNIQSINIDVYITGLSQGLDGLYQYVNRCNSGTSGRITVPIYITCYHYNRDSNSYEKVITHI